MKSYEERVQEVIKRRNKQINTSKRSYVDEKGEVIKANTVAGKYTGKCVCGNPIEQIWREKYQNWTNYDRCSECRAKVGSEANCGVSRANIVYTPHSGGQQLVHASDKRFKLICAGSRWGKDRCSIMEFIMKFAQMLSEDRPSDLVPKVHGWFIAPTYLMARQTWREFKAFFPREWVVNFWESDKMVETVEGGIIEIRSADDPDMLVGVGLDIVVITEAARISKLDEVWTNIETRLLSPGRGPGGNGGVALINGTPKGRGYYYRMYTWGQEDSPYYDPDWESWSFTSWDNPHLTTRDKNYLERIMKRYPERIYRQEILAEFLAEGSSVFPRADSCAVYTGPSEPQVGEIYTIGYDPAKEVDYSGVVIRNSFGEAVKVIRWTGMPWPLQIENMVNYSRRYNYAKVTVDKTGVGDTIPSQLMQHGVEVDPVHFTNPEKERMVNHLAMLIEQQAISYPDDDALLNELKDYQYSVTKSGLIRYSASLQRGHDDLVTAMMLAFRDYNQPQVTLPFMGVIRGIRKKLAIA